MNFITGNTFETSGHTEGFSVETGLFFLKPVSHYYNRMNFMKQFHNHLSIFLEIINDASCCRRSYVVNLFKFFISEMKTYFSYQLSVSHYFLIHILREKFPGLPSYLRYSERHEKIGEWHISACLDTLQYILEFLFFEAFESENFVAPFSEMIQGNKIRKESLFYKNIDYFIAESQYISTVFSSKTLQSSRSLHRTGCAGRTIKSNFPRISDEGRSATRTSGRRNDRFLGSIAHFCDRSDDFWNYFPGSDDEYLISFHYSFFGELVIVMKCGTTHSHSSDIYRFEDGNRSYNPGSTDGMYYSKEFGSDMYRWEFVCDRIAWMMFGCPEHIPERETIKFDNKSVDFEIEYRTRESQSMDFGLEFLQISGAVYIRSFGKSKRFKERKIIAIGCYIEVFSSFLSFCVRKTISIKSEFARCSDSIIELSETSRCGISWIGKYFFSCLHSFTVDSCKFGNREYDFSTNLDFAGCKWNRSRNTLNLKCINSYIFSLHSISSCQRSNELAIAIRE